VRVARLGASNQLARQLDKGCKQHDCAVPHIVVRHRACAVGRQRKPELRSFERLALAFLVAAQHERFRRRIEIEPDHVPEFLFELRIIREFEGLQAMRFQVVFRPDALNRARRDPGVTAHRADAPAGLPLRRPCRLGDDARHFRIWDRWLATATWLVVQTVEARSLETPRPQGNALRRCLQPLGGSRNADAVEPQQNDVGAFHVAGADGG
jgi:hypothetical protein